MKSIALLIGEEKEHPVSVPLRIIVLCLREVATNAAAPRWWSTTNGSASAAFSRERVCELVPVGMFSLSEIKNVSII